MSLEEKISLTKKVLAYVFITCFTLTTIIGSVIIYFFLSSNPNLTYALKISAILGFLLSSILTFGFYLNFKTYDNLEHLISDLCSDNKRCALKSMIFLLVHFNLGKKYQKMTKNNICRNSNSPCDSCTEETCRNCKHKGGDK